MLAADWQTATAFSAHNVQWLTSPTRPASPELPSPSQLPAPLTRQVSNVTYERPVSLRSGTRDCYRHLGAEDFSVYATCLSSEGASGNRMARVGWGGSIEAGEWERGWGSVRRGCRWKYGRFARRF